MILVEIFEGGQTFDIESDMAPSKKGGELPHKEVRGVQEPAVEDDNYFSANSQKPTFLEAGKPKMAMKKEVGDFQLAPAGGGTEVLSAEVDKFPSKEEWAPTSPAS